MRCLCLDRGKTLHAFQPAVLRQWTRNGHELFYHNGDKVMAVESDFRVQRKMKSVWSDLATVSADTTTYRQLNPAKGNWQYRVRAENASGPSGWSNTASARVR